MAQGKAFNKKKILEALQPKFQMGYAINKACVLCGINPELLYDWTKKDPTLLVKIQGWQAEPDEEARKQILIAIKDGSTEDAWKWLKGKEKDEWSEKSQSESEIKISGLTKEQQDSIDEYFKNKEVA